MTSDAAGCRLRIAVLCPHFAPDTAPTGVVMTRIVAELAELGHELHVVTSLPWYRTHAVEAGWETRWFRREVTDWGVDHTGQSVRRRATSATSLRRAAGFVGFSALAGVASLRGGRVDAVIAMSPPLTMGLTGWGTHLVRRGPLVFNIQDVFPDAAIETGAITNATDHRCGEMARTCQLPPAAAVTVLSNDLRDNVVAKVRPSRHDDVAGDPELRRHRRDPTARPAGPALRDELGIGDETVVIYAGNVGFSQSLEMVVAAARSMPELTFLINGDGGGTDVVGGVRQRPGERSLLRLPARRASRRGVGNRRHPPRSPQSRASVGSACRRRRIRSSPQAGRCWRRSIRAPKYPGSSPNREGECRWPPTTSLRSSSALQQLADDPAGRSEMAVAGRAWVEHAASPAAVARAYADLIVELNRRP